MQIVILILIFLMVGIGFLFVNLLVGKLIRPHKPSEDKGAIYECGEPTIGSSWIQFDLRFYVVALLFVIFDVEMAFFFPWATVFGDANRIANGETPAAMVASESASAVPAEEQQAAARKFAWIAFADILFFFGVLLVGFAYLWKRGDIDWVRTTIAQQDQPQAPT